ncbi:lysophospholipid acyltransferase family protein [Paracoccus sp. (in: a-proteobacteria)]|uniref:lysophospholipid acyltransferase family protein n=1 Tax=Paracoccus sp. TaxID=267 RepID=UPI0028A0EDC7|nr:lysophospholipid acyltransferase family protein [Paracoccus sp. (in: a-proteobacteria)]
MTQDSDEIDDKPPIGDRIGNAAFLTLMALAKALPYERRIPAVGWFFAHILGPVAGWRKRIRANLALARPDLDAAEVRRLTRAVPNNAGRSIAEIYSGREFTARIQASNPLYGPGLPALEEAAATGRPVIIACAHFGNYDAFRAALHAKGWPIGALYRPMNNEAFNEHYIPAMKSIAEPLFPRGRSGLAAMLRFLKGGGWLALGFDQFDGRGAELQFFGLPTKTVLTPAELAIRYDALVVPVAGIRQEDGLSFRVQVGEPVPLGDPAQMMQHLNDDLEALIRLHMEQWLWIHRRWKRRN